MMKSFGLTDKGIVRKDNQDCFIIERCESQNCLVLALCDGMGGAKAGGVASQLSNKAFVSHIYGKLTSRVKKRLDYETLLKEACARQTGYPLNTPSLTKRSTAWELPWLAVF